MALSNCPDFDILVNWLEQPALARSSEISDHVAVCERCTALVAAGAAEFRRIAVDHRQVEPANVGVAPAPQSGRSPRSKRSLAVWTIAATVAVVSGTGLYWATHRVDPNLHVFGAQEGSKASEPSADRESNKESATAKATSDTRDPSLGPPIAEWSRQEIIEFITSSRSHETNELAKIYYRCRDERIDEAVPRALRIYRQSTPPVPGVAAKHVIAARAFLETYTPQEIEAALKKHGNQWMTYDQYVREQNEKGANR